MWRTIKTFDELIVRNAQAMSTGEETPWRISDPSYPNFSEPDDVLKLNSLGFVVATYDDDDAICISGLIQKYKLYKFRDALSRSHHFIAILDYGITQDPEIMNPGKHMYHHSEVWDLLQTEVYDDLRLYTSNIVEITAIGDDTLVSDLIEAITVANTEIPVPSSIITLPKSFAKYFIDKSRPCAHESCESRISIRSKNIRCHQHQTDEEYRNQRA